jgi:1,4-dihydroxy-6-naphthoate synthase
MTHTIAFSPCPNDTFIMYAVVHKKIELFDFNFEAVMLDIEDLNLNALNNSYAITKASAAIFQRVKAFYSILNSGAAFGTDGGPLLVAKPNVVFNKNSVIALPGEHTTANALFEKFFKQAHKKKYVLFSTVFEQIIEGSADAGVVIHEDRFTYGEHGLTCVMDLGKQWKKNIGLPVPLGVFLASNGFAKEQKIQLSKIIADSIAYSRKHYEEVFPWIQSHSDNKDKRIIRQHINYYVNNLSLSMGQVGKTAIEHLKK